MREHCFLPVTSPMQGQFFFPVTPPMQRYFFPSSKTPKDSFSLFFQPDTTDLVTSFPFSDTNKVGMFFPSSDTTDEGTIFPSSYTTDAGIFFLFSDTTNITWISLHTLVLALGVRWGRSFPSLTWALDDLVPALVRCSVWFSLLLCSRLENSLFVLMTFVNWNIIDEKSKIWIAHQNWSSDKIFQIGHSSNISASSSFLYKHCSFLKENPRTPPPPKTSVLSGSEKFSF